MSNPQTPPPPPAGWVLSNGPGHQAPKRRSVGWIVGAVVIVALLAGAGVAAVAFVRDQADSKVSYPEAWAPEVLPYVGIVEEKRDLQFLHPIHVEFLTEKDFRAEVTADEKDLSDEDREQMKEFTEMSRAMGLIEGDVDFFQAANDLSGAGTIGYYSFDDKRIRIRGTRLTPASKMTLVHELTHALQDQHYDLATRYEYYEEHEDDPGHSAFDSIVEGDARRIETAYHADLSKKQRAAVAAEQRRAYKQFEKEAADVPQFLKTVFAAPYDLGEAMLELGVERDGEGAVNGLFVNPPDSDEQLLDPWTVGDVTRKPIAVDEPELRDGEEEFDSGHFGALTWYLMLAERLPLVDALDAADGWGGDAYVAFKRDDRTCVRIAYRGDTDPDRDQMRAALRTWIAALPGSKASVKASGTELVFESCDPGADANVGRNASEAALRLALTRTGAGIGILRDGVPENVARCFADGIVHEFTVERIMRGFQDVDSEAQAKLSAIGSRCR